MIELALCKGTQSYWNSKEIKKWRHNTCITIMFAMPEIQSLYQTVSEIIFSCCLTESEHRENGGSCEVIYRLIWVVKASMFGSSKHAGYGSSNF